MNAFPSSNNGVDAVAREAAKEAAHRAGMTLSEYLNRVIAEQASELGGEAHDLDATARIEALTARMSRPPTAEPLLGFRAHPRSRPGREREAWRTRGGSLDKNYFPSLEERSAADADPPSASNNSADDGQPRAVLKHPDGGALASLAEQLAEIEQRLHRTNGATRPIRTALARLERELSACQTDNDTVVETQFSPLESDIRALLDALRANSMAASSCDDSSPGPDGAGPLNSNLIPAASAISQPAEQSAPIEAAAVDRAMAQADEQSKYENDAPDPILMALDKSLTTIAQQLGLAQSDRRENPLAASSGSGDFQQFEQLPSESIAQIVALRSEMTELSASMAAFSPHVSIDSLETAVQQLAAKIDASTDPRLRESLIAPVETIAADLRNMLRSADYRSLLESLDQDVKAAARQIRTLVTEHQPATSEHLRELREGLTSLAGKPMPFDKLERQLVSLAERVERLAADGASRAAIGQIMTALDAVNHQLSDNAPAAALKHIDQQIAALSARIDHLAATVPSHRIIEDLSNRLDAGHHALVARIEQSRPPAVDITGVESMVATLASKFDVSATAEARNFSALDVQIAKIAARIERLAAEGASRAHAAELAASLLEVRRSVAATAPADLMQAVSKRIDNLANKVTEFLITSPKVAKNYEELARRLDTQIGKVADRIERLANDGAPQTHATELAASLAEMRERIAASSPADSMQNLSERIDTLVSKVDEVLLTSPSAAQSYEELTNRIAAVHHSLAARLDLPQPPPKIEATNLEIMVRALAAKIDAVRPAEIEPRSLDSIEAQISRIADKIDRSDEGLVSLASLQRSIVDLFAQLEETRHAALDAAETAARTAARDTLREARLIAPATQERSVPEDHEAAEQISRQLTELRAQQDNSDRRVNSTLSVVQATLEKIAGRLAALNDHVDHPILPLTSAASAKEMQSNVVFTEKSTYGLESALDILAKVVERRGSGETEVKAQSVPTSPGGSPNNDFLIEPGSGYAPSQKDEAARSGSGQAVFIAAARRAAQVAAAESATTKRPSTPNATDDVLPTKPKPWFSAYNLKLLLGLGCVAAVSVTIIAYQLAYGSLPTSDSLPAQINLAAKADAAPLAASPSDGGGANKPALAAAPTSRGPNETADTIPGSSGTFSKNGANGKEDAAGATLGPLPGMTTSHLAQPPEAPAGSPIMPQLSPGASSGLTEAAQAGNAAAQYELGTRFADGRDVNRDFKQAAGWFEKAATQGLAPAQFRLGTLYEKGLGVQRDEAIAKLWYQRAGERGNAHAMHNLAVLTAEGSSKPDYGTAAIWFHKAAELGVRDSQYNIAILYARGLGIEQSLPQSYMWFSIAAAQGDEDAARKRDEVAARLDPNSLETAKALVSQFQTKVPDPSANEVVTPLAGWGAVGTKVEPKTPARLPTKPKVSRL